MILECKNDNKACAKPTFKAKPEVPRPSDEEVTQRAGSLQAMTGLTPQECAVLLLHFEHALAA
jgi:hypothetical protein